MTTTKPRRPVGRPPKQREEGEEAKPRPRTRVEPIDLHLGMRIRQLRTYRNMTRPELAGRLGLSQEMVEKYERAEARVGAGRLLDISHVLAVPVESFYEGFVPGESRLIAPDDLPSMRIMSPANQQLLLDFEALTEKQRDAIRERIRAFKVINSDDPAGAGSAG